MLNSGKRYNDLNVWLEARKLSKDIYSLTAEFPKEEQFGLISQMRRSAISIPSNIAEGCGRNYPKDSIQFFYIASDYIVKNYFEGFRKCHENVLLHIRCNRNDL